LIVHVLSDEVDSDLLTFLKLANIFLKVDLLNGLLFLLLLLVCRVLWKFNSSKRFVQLDVVQDSNVCNKCLVQQTRVLVAAFWLREAFRRYFRIC